MKRYPEDIVLIGVLKSRDDLNLLLRKKLYRIPLCYAPKRKASYIAFYQPSIFTKTGRRINYYAKIKDCQILKRREILPWQPDHPMADEDYYLISLEKLKKLPRSVINKNRMRISFGFTTLTKLSQAKRVSELFDIPPIEEILLRAFIRHQIKALREYSFTLPDKKRYRLDFVIFCQRGSLNIECDGEKWHSQRFQKTRDAIRDKDLKKEGFSIYRLQEKDIVKDIEKCINKIKRKIRKLGGIKILPYG